MAVGNDDSNEVELLVGVGLEIAANELTVSLVASSLIGDSQISLIGRRAHELSSLVLIEDDEVVATWVSIDA